MWAKFLNDIDDNDDYDGEWEENRKDSIHFEGYKAKRAPTCPVSKELEDSADIWGELNDR